MILMCRSRAARNSGRVSATYVPGSAWSSTSDRRRSVGGSRTGTRAGAAGARKAGVAITGTGTSTGVAAASGVGRVAEAARGAGKAALAGLATPVTATGAEGARRALVAGLVHPGLWCCATACCTRPTHGAERARPVCVAREGAASRGSEGRPTTVGTPVASAPGGGGWLGCGSWLLAGAGGKSALKEMRLETCSQEWW